MNWIAPLMTPSFITLGPATLTQFTLTSPIPSALACFSTSLARSMTISGRKLTPYCCATLISLTSAVAPNASTASKSAETMRLNVAMIAPKFRRPSRMRLLRTTRCRARRRCGARHLILRLSLSQRQQPACSDLLEGLARNALRILHEKETLRDEPFRDHARCEVVVAHRRVALLDRRPRVTGDEPVSKRPREGYVSTGECTDLIPEEAGRGHIPAEVRAQR